MKKIVLSLLFIFSLVLITGCNKIDKTNNTEINLDTKEEDKEYDINFENNETVKSLVKLLPLEITMNELNGNEKYVYLDTSLSTNSLKPKHINSGDVMLYGDDCLVIFYKSFDTSYSYTRIGHINNLPNLGGGSINVKIVEG